MKQKLWGIISLTVAASIWGGTYVVSKYVMDYIPPFTLLWLRYCVGALVLGTVMIATGEYRIAWKDWKLLVGIGFVGYFLSVGTQFIGTKLSDAHTGALIAATAPVFVLVFARWLLKESLSVKKWIALFISLVGIVIVIGLGDQAQSSFLGNLFLVVAAATWALLSVMAKLAAQRYTVLTITTYALLAAIVFTTPAMFWELKSAGMRLSTMITDFVLADAYLLWGVLYLGVISTAIAFFLWNKGMELMDAGAGSFFIFLQPIVGSVLGWLLLSEQITLSFFVGGILIAIGMAIVNQTEQQAISDPQSARR